MIYVPSKKIKQTVVGQRDISTTEGGMNKSNLDRSSRSVIDGYVQKFELAEQNLNALKTYLQDLRDLVEYFRDELEREFKIALPELSMGMSDDYEVAAEEGATMIRIGRKLFM